MDDNQIIELERQKLGYSPTLRQREIEAAKEAEKVAKDRPSVVWDVVRAVPSGIDRAITEGAKFVDEVVKANNLPRIEYTGEDGKAKGLMELAVDNATPDIAAAETVPGQIVEGVTQFAAPFAVTKKIKAFQVMASGGKFARATAAVLEATQRGAVVDAAFFDPFAGRLTDLAKDTPIDAVLPDWLESAEDDSAAELRLKSAIEGAGLGIALDSLVYGYKALRRQKRLREALEARKERVALPKSAANPPPPEAKPEAKPEASPAAAPEAAPKAAYEDAAHTTDADKPGSKLILDKAAIDADARAYLDGEPKELPPDIIGINARTFDWAGMKDGADIFDVINRVAELLDPHIKDARGIRPRSQKEAASLGALIGQTGEDVLRNADRVHNLDAHIIASKKVLVASAARLQELAAQAAKTGADADMMEYLRHYERHATIQASIRKARAEVGRGLNAYKYLDVNGTADDFKMFSDVMIRYGGNQNVRDMAARIAKLRDAGAINKMVRRTWYQKTGDVLLELYINNLLSSVKGTVVLNNLANALQVVTGTAERAVAAGIGKMRLAKDASAEVVEAHEVAQGMLFGNLAGMVDAVRLAGRNAKKVALEGEPITDPIERLEHADRKAIYMDTRGLEGSHLTAAKVVNATGEIVRLPQRALMTGDEFFKTLAYRQQLHALAARTASREARLQGLEGDAWKAYVERRQKDILLNPPDEVAMSALDYARYQTFQTDLGHIGKAVQNLVNRAPALRLVMPFIKTPTNILKQSFERFPVAAHFMGEVRAEYAKGGAARDMVIAKQAMGAVYFGAAWALVETGAITGSMGADSKNRAGGQAGVRADGKIPYSIKVGDTYIAYNRLDPVASLLASMANYREIMAAAGTDIDGDLETEVHEGIALSFLAVMQMAGDKAWTQGLADAIEAYEADDKGASFMRWVNRTGSNFVPAASLQRSVAASVDPVVREAFTFSETVKKMVPGLSDELPAKRDFLGREVRLDTGGPAVLNFVSPFAVSGDRDDPVSNEVGRLGLQVQPLPKTLGGVKLDVHQYGRLTELVGTVTLGGLTIEQAMAKEIASPRYARLTDDDGAFTGSKADRLKAIVAAYRAKARDALYKEDGELALTVLARKRLAAEAKKPKR